MMMIGAWYYLTRVNPNDKEKLFEVIKDAFETELDHMIADAVTLVDDLEDWSPEKAPTIEWLMT